MRGRFFFHAPRLTKWASMLATVVFGWLAGEHLRHGAHLVGQGGWPSLFDLFFGHFFRRFLLDFECHFGLHPNRGLRNTLLFLKLVDGDCVCRVLKSRPQPANFSCFFFCWAY